MFVHDQDGLKDRVNVQYEILLEGERVVNRFLVRWFLVYSIRDDLFLLHLGLGDVDSNVTILCLLG